MNTTKALPCLDIRKEADFEGVVANLFRNQLNLIPTLEALTTMSELIGRGTSPVVKRISLKIRNLKQDQSILQLSSL